MNYPFFPIYFSNNKYAIYTNISVSFGQLLGLYLYYRPKFSKEIKYIEGCIQINDNDKYKFIKCMKAQFTINTNIYI